MSGCVRSARRRVGRGKVSKIVGGMVVGGERRMCLSCESGVQVLQATARDVQKEVCLDEVRESCPASYLRSLPRVMASYIVQ